LATSAAAVEPPLLCRVPDVGPVPSRNPSLSVTHTQNHKHTQNKLSLPPRVCACVCVCVCPSLKNTHALMLKTELKDRRAFVLRIGRSVRIHSYIAQPLDVSLSTASYVCEACHTQTPQNDCYPNVRHQRGRRCRRVRPRASPSFQRQRPAAPVRSRLWRWEGGRGVRRK